jgi:sulfotransferase family protein
LNMQGGLTRGAVPNPKHHEEQAQRLRKIVTGQREKAQRLRKVVSRQRKALQRKDRQIEEQAQRLKKVVTRQRKALRRKDQQIEEQAVTLETLRERRQREIRLRKELKDTSLEIFHLNNELDAMKALVENAGDAPSAEQVSGEPDVGALPDFVIIGAQKGGTSFLYHLLTRHPLVEPAARKELHFFDNPELFDHGDEWYRRCFPRLSAEDGQKSITGEATPYYLFDPPVAKRMAEIVPKARLIALLRNPIDRAYSHYQMQVKRGTEPRTFEEAMEQHSSYMSRGIYVDQLLRWFEFFGKEQMLILKSEDFFARPLETLKVVLTFLDLPDWQPEASELQQRRHSGTYKQKMDPSTRQQLEAYFEPHNQRLYECLDIDFGW